MNCGLYRAYDWFKQRRLASLLFYYGERFRHFGEIRVLGTVTQCIHGNADGDVSFDLLAPDLVISRWHVEATPCNPLTQVIARGLKPGQVVTVWGTQTFDPPHHIFWKKFSGGGNEIHPATTILVMK